MLKALQIPDMLERVLVKLTPEKREQAKALQSGMRGLLQHPRTKVPQPNAKVPQPNAKRVATAEGRGTGAYTDMGQQ